MSNANRHLGRLNSGRMADTGSLLFANNKKAAQGYGLEPLVPVYGPPKGTPLG